MTIKQVWIIIGIKPLEPRGITAEYHGIVSQEDLEEQAKLVNMILNLVYWDSNIA